jgi:D-apiose dehydrogenase
VTGLKVVTVGAGYFSAFHHDAWARLPEVDLAAVCDLDPAKAQAFAERFGVPRHYADVAAMLDREQPDLVDIATPPATHLALIRETMARRLPTICQKAFCRSLDEAREAVQGWPRRRKRCWSCTRTSASSPGTGSSSASSTPGGSARSTR